MIQLMMEEMLESSLGMKRVRQHGDSGIAEYPQPRVR